MLTAVLLIVVTALVAFFSGRAVGRRNASLKKGDSFTVVGVPVVNPPGELRIPRVAVRLEWKDGHTENKRLFAHSYDQTQPLIWRNSSFVYLRVDPAGVHIWGEVRP